MVDNCGIILAGGNGTRLNPLTTVVNKHLLPIYDKPMIFYPLSSLMLAGIRDIAIITRPQDSHLYSQLFSRPEDLGISIKFLIQEKPSGIPDAYIVAKDFIGTRSVTLILGDNLFLGQNLGRTLSNSLVSSGAKIFAFPVSNPKDYGVVSFDKATKKVNQIIEKPNNFVSNLAVPGIYFTDNEVCEIVKSLKASPRGELEIVDLLNIYISRNKLEVEVFQRGIGWMDAGSISSLFEASDLVQVLQRRQGLRFNSPDEIAWRNNWITDSQLAYNANKYAGTEYGDYLTSLLN
jgi:glucose-1-phosphate thymidylyltransferase